MYGTVRKGEKYTRFRLEIVLDNQCTFYEVHTQSNELLNLYPKLYGWTLDMLTERLKTRVENRAQ